MPGMTFIRCYGGYNVNLPENLSQQSFVCDVKVLTVVWAVPGGVDQAVCPGSVT